MSLPGIRECDFQDQVVQLAQLQGWRVYHPFDSRRSVAGFPDLTLVRGSELIFAELKTDTGRVRAEQLDWIDALRTVAAAVENAAGRLVGVPGADQPPPAVEVHIWRPSNFDEILARLRRRATTTDRREIA